jgi:predicted DNA-binding protein YlxM (UPF0122 family)
MTDGQDSKRTRQAIVQKIVRTVDHLQDIEEQMRKAPRFATSSPELERAIQQAHAAIREAIRVANDQQAHQLAVIAQL